MSPEPTHKRRLSRLSLAACILLAALGGTLAIEGLRKVVRSEQQILDESPEVVARKQSLAEKRRRAEKAAGILAEKGAKYSLAGGKEDRFLDLTNWRGDIEDLAVLADFDLIGEVDEYGGYHLILGPTLARDARPYLNSLKHVR